MSLREDEETQAEMLLFVYGTLHPERAPAAIADVVARFCRVGEGTIGGRLYQLGGYPGVRLDGDGAGRVAGTVFHLPAEAELLRRLDDYEGYRPESADSSLFVRRQTLVHLQDGRMLQCWVYEFNGRVGP